MRGSFDWRWLFIAVSACHSGEPLALAKVLVKPDSVELANGTPDCAGDDECNSGVCQLDVDGTPRCCNADCLANGRVCAATGQCVCSSQQREIAGACLLDKGEPCGGAAECASQQCADGVCCDAPCDGLCERCDAPSQPGVCASYDEDPSCLKKIAVEGVCDAYPEPDLGCPVPTCDPREPCVEYRAPAPGSCSGTGQCAPCEPLHTRAGAACGVGAQCDGAGACRVTGLGRIAAGANHTCGILNDGNVRCWGSNEHGQLGTLDDLDPLVPDNLLVGDDEDPADIPALDFGPDAWQVAAGLAHTCVLFDDGTVRCWGRLIDEPRTGTVAGLLGTNDVVRDGRGFAKPLDTGDVRLSERAVQISAASSGAHSCALLASGQLSCWGLNVNGQCGYGYEGQNVGGESDEELPVIGLDAVALQVSAGTGHTCALLEGGLVTCWGNGSLGQLGYGNKTDRSRPLDAVLIGAPALQVTAGLGFTCALLEQGRVRCWGGNGDGALGYGHAEQIGDNETPDTAATTPGPSGSTLLGGDVNIGGLGVVQISARPDVSAVCALFSKSGAVRCWGANLGGQLGYGHNETLGTRFTPDELAGRGRGGDLALGGPALALSIGGRCALLESGALYCWGANEDAELGLPGFRDGSLTVTPFDMGAVRWE